MKLKKETIKKWKQLLPQEYRVQLNSTLVRRHDLSKEEVGIIFAMHGGKCYLFDEAYHLLKNAAERKKLTKEDFKRMQEIKEEIRLMEFKAQKAWHFDEDETRHTWWMDLPGCTCPKMDNQDRLGVKEKIYSSDCPWHGTIDALVKFKKPKKDAK